MFGLVLFWSEALRVVKMVDGVIETWEMENSSKKDQN